MVIHFALTLLEPLPIGRACLLQLCPIWSCLMDEGKVRREGGGGGLRLAEEATGKMGWESNETVCVVHESWPPYESMSNRFSCTPGSQSRPPSATRTLDRRAANCAPLEDCPASNSPSLQDCQITLRDYPLTKMSAPHKVVSWFPCICLL